MLLLLQHRGPSTLESVGPLCDASGVTFLRSSVEGVTHGEGVSTVQLSNGAGVLRGSLVLDATGHSRRLVQYDDKFDPGYQGAYGIIAGGCLASALTAYLQL